MRKIVKPELLAPAGNMEKLKMALLYGADAVYLGGKMFGLRASANNFTIEELKEAVEFAHGLGKKVYVTVNIFAHNEDIDHLPEYLKELEKCQVDALLISDFGIWSLAKQIIPNMELHVSTQGNTTNWASTQAWADLGASRVVLARELSLKEIDEIGSKTTVELETFVHGAMCISYSGRCLLSSFLTGRDGNRGECAQACRWDYGLTEKNRTGEVYDIEEDERGTYIMNSKDLCLIEYLPELMKAGVCSFKIEGRMKSIHYVATVVGAYRKAIDACFADPDNYKVDPLWMEELNKVSHRPYTTGFSFGKPGNDGQVYTTSSYEQSHDFVALVEGYNATEKRVYLEQRNNLKAEEVLEVLTPAGDIKELVLRDMRNEKGEPIEVAAHAKQKFSCACDEELIPNSLVRRLIVS